LAQATSLTHLQELRESNLDYTVACTGKTKRICWCKCEGVSGLFRNNRGCRLYSCRKNSSWL